jgi:hypothetical protein
MTTATTIPAGGTREYLRDRYDRLRNGSETLASDPTMSETDSIYGAEGLRAFTTSVIDARLLDGLSENDADTVDHAGPTRLHSWARAHGVAAHRLAE